MDHLELNYSSIYLRGNSHLLHLTVAFTFYSKLNLKLQKGNKISLNNSTTFRNMVESIVNNPYTLFVSHLKNYPSFTNTLRLLT